MRKNSILRKVPITRRDIRTWPHVDENSLPADKKGKFRLRRKAIAALLAEASYQEIAKETGLRPGFVRQLLDRCISPDGTGDICGERALVSNTHIHAYRRKKPIARTQTAGRGYCSGALTQLFDEFPEIEERLESEIFNRIPAGVKISEARISITNLHKVFLQLCESAGRTSTNEWPLNTRTKGRTSLSNFFRRLATKHPSEYIRARFGKDSATRIAVGTGHDRILLPQVPYDVIGLDEFTFDAITTITLSVPGGGEQDIAIERINIVLVIERVSGAICSWYAFFRASAAASDIRQAMQKAITPWEPTEFSIPGLRYGSPDAGMPSGLITGLQYHPWTILVVDNALAHQDLGLLADLGSIPGCIVNLGPVGAWYRRADVERTIGDVLIQSAQRLPSTTGNNPLDSRKNDPVDTAVKLKIRWADVRQVLEVVIAQQNAMPSEGIGWLSPIELLRQHVAESSQTFLRRPLPLALHSPICLSTVTQEVPVRGSQKDGRRPFVRVDRANYTNSILAKSWGLIGKKLRLAINEDAMREIGASVMGSGVDLGMLVVQGAWSRTPHTRAMRKAINQLRDRRILAIPPGADPVANYLKYLAESAHAEARKKSGKRRISRSGSRLAEIEQRTGLTASAAQQRDVADVPVVADGWPPPVSAFPQRPSLRDLRWQENDNSLRGMP
jgi:putative transposase